MKFGTGTWHFSGETVIYALRQIGSVGYSIAEIWMEHLQITGEDTQAVRSTAATLGLELTLHASSYDLNLSSINTGAREEAKRQTIESIVAAARLGASIVVIHPGRRSTDKESLADSLFRLYEALRELDEVAASENVTLALEIMHNRPNELVALPESVNRLMGESWRSLKLTFDVAHAHSVMSPPEYLKQIDPTRIAHVHVKDLDSSNRQTPLGHGHLAIRESIETLSTFYSGSIIVEGYNTGNAIDAIRESYRFLRVNGWV